MLKCLVFVLCVITIVFCAPGYETLREKQSTLQEQVIDQLNGAPRTKRQSLGTVDFVYLDIASVEPSKSRDLQSKESFHIAPINDVTNAGQNFQQVSETNLELVTQNSNYIVYKLKSTGDSSLNALTGYKSTEVPNNQYYSDNREQYSGYSAKWNPLSPTPDDGAPPPPPPPDHHPPPPPPPPHHHSPPRGGDSHHHPQPPPPPAHHHHPPPPPPPDDYRSSYYDRSSYYNRPPPPPPPRSELDDRSRRFYDDRLTRQSSYDRPPPPHRGPPPHARDRPPQYDEPSRHHERPPQDFGGPPRHDRGPPPPRHGPSDRRSPPYHGGPSDRYEYRPPPPPDRYYDGQPPPRHGPPDRFGNRPPYNRGPPPPHNDRRPPPDQKQDYEQGNYNNKYTLNEGHTSKLIDNSQTSLTTEAAANFDQYQLDVRFNDDQQKATDDIKRDITVTTARPLSQFIFQAAAVTPED